MSLWSHATNNPGFFHFGYGGICITLSSWSHLLGPNSQILILFQQLLWFLPLLALHLSEVFQLILLGLDLVVLYHEGLNNYFRFIFFLIFGDQCNLVYHRLVIFHIFILLNISIYDTWKLYFCCCCVTFIVPISLDIELYLFIGGPFLVFNIMTVLLMTTAGSHTPLIGFFRACYHSPNKHRSESKQDNLPWYTGDKKGKKHNILHCIPRQLLQRDSFHAPQTFNGIPKGQFIRVRKICSDDNVY